jgi:hypothetical protein
MLIKLLLDPWAIYNCNLPGELTIALPWALTVLFNLGVLVLVRYITSRQAARSRHLEDLW